MTGGERGRLIIPGRPAAASLAYVRHPARTPGRPGLVHCHGFRSGKDGQKALAVEALAAAEDRALVRFDLSGHGESDGRFEDGTVGAWRDDLLAVLDHLTDGPQILIGSSLGGWLALHAACDRPQRVAGLVLLAPATDFTERLVWQRMDAAMQERLLRDGVHWYESAYEPAPYPITRRLVEEGRMHLLLTGRPVAIGCPVRLLHGMADPDVPWQASLELVAALAGGDVRLTLIKDGDHRLSRPADLALLAAVVQDLAGPA